MNSSDSSKRSLINITNKQRYLFFGEKQYLNLSSNDYLALSSLELQQEFIDKVDPFKNFVLSNPSSRLMSGNSLHYDRLERSIAQLFNRESSLVLSSGFILNSTLIAALTEKRDLIIADKLVHASMIDGVKLAGCNFERFRHNDIKHLRHILESCDAKYERVFVMVESIYSMDGDCAPLKELVALKREFGFTLYVDEAHAFGVRGEKGCGLSEELDIESEVDILVATLGKAASSQGGFVVCSEEIKDRLVNKMRGLIFSTAMADITLMWSKFIIDKMAGFGDRREKLKFISKKLVDILAIKGDNSHIIPIVLGSNDKAVEAQNILKDAGYWVSAIRHPTVAKGSERLRISLSADITIEEISVFAEKVLNLQSCKERF